jgi:hypothetical protein
MTAWIDASKKPIDAALIQQVKIGDKTERTLICAPSRSFKIAGTRYSEITRELQSISSLAF